MTTYYLTDKADGQTVSLEVDLETFNMMVKVMNLQMETLDEEEHALNSGYANTLSELLGFEGKLSLDEQKERDVPDFPNRKVISLVDQSFNGFRAQADIPLRAGNNTNRPSAKL